jgi:hypothetical protein
MFSEKTTTILLAVMVVALSYQTMALSQINSKLQNSDINIGAGSSAVNFSSDGSAPEMVGGC